MVGRGFPLGLSVQVMGEEGKVVLAAESSVITMLLLLVVSPHPYYSQLPAESLYH